MIRTSPILTRRSQNRTQQTSLRMKGQLSVMILCIMRLKMIPLTSKQEQSPLHERNGKLLTLLTSGISAACYASAINSMQFSALPKNCGETSAWPGTCADFNPRNLAPPKHHARLRCASFGWHVRQRKSYPHGMPQKHWSKNAKVLGQKKLCWKCWGKKSLRWTRKSHIGTLLPRDVSLHDCRHIEIDA